MRSTFKKMMIISNSSKANRMKKNTHLTDSNGMKTCQIRLQNNSEIEDKFKGVAFARDMTTEQREDRKHKREEAKKQKEAEDMEVTADKDHTIMNTTIQAPLPNLSNFLNSTINDTTIPGGVPSQPDMTVNNAEGPTSPTLPRD